MPFPIPRKPKGREKRRLPPRQWPAERHPIAHDYHHHLELRYDRNPYNKAAPFGSWDMPGFAIMRERERRRREHNWTFSVVGSLIGATVCLWVVPPFHLTPTFHSHFLFFLAFPLPAS